jgi:hypothetical protein
MKLDIAHEYWITYDTRTFDLIVGSISPVELIETSLSAEFIIPPPVDPPPLAALYSPFRLDLTATVKSVPTAGFRLRLLP